MSKCKKSMVEFGTWQLGNPESKFEVFKHSMMCLPLICHSVVFWLFRSCIHPNQNLIAARSIISIHKPNKRSNATLKPSLISVVQLNRSFTSVQNSSEAWVKADMSWANFGCPAKIWAVWRMSKGCDVDVKCLTRTNQNLSWHHATKLHWRSLVNHHLLYKMSKLDTWMTF